MTNRTRAAGLGAAIAFHVVIALGFVLAIQIPRMIEPPAVQVSLVPAIPMETTPHARPAPQRREQERTPPPPATPRPGQVVGPAPVPPLPIPAAPPPDQRTRDALLNAPFAAPRDDLHRSLRTGSGCVDADANNLTAAEREKCRKHNRALGANAPTYEVGPSSHSQRAYLKKQAEANDRRQRELQAPPSRAMVPCQGPMSNVGFSCTPPAQDGDAHIRF